MVYLSMLYRFHTHHLHPNLLQFCICS